LRPGGTLLVSVWCPLSENPAAAIVHGVLSRMFEDDPPQFLQHPSETLDAETMEALAREAGFANVSVSRVDVLGRAASAKVVAAGFAKGSFLTLELVERGADLDVVTAALEAELAPHGGGPFRSPIAALVLAAS